jgi:hypothetical protein
VKKNPHCCIGVWGRMPRGKPKRAAATRKSKSKEQQPEDDEDVDVPQQAEPEAEVSSTSSSSKKSGSGRKISSSSGGRKKKIAASASDDPRVANVLEFCDPESWDLEDIDEVRRKLKRVCNEFAQIEDIDSSKDVDLVSALKRFALVLYESDIPFAGGSGKKKNPEQMMLQSFSACGFVEVFRLVDNPFEDLSKSNQDVYLIKTLEFFLQIINSGIHESGSDVFPLLFHVLEVLSNRSSFLLVSRIQKDSKKHALILRIFETLIDVSSRSLLNQVREFLFEIVKDLILEPEINISEEVISVLLSELVHPKVRKFTPRI